MSRRLPERLNRHLANAELDLRHPVRSALRLVPLRVKERINRAAGRPLFDLSFYLRFQPQSVMISETLVAPLRYVPRPAEGRRRIAFFTPHLGPGGAESVLLDVAGSLDRAQSEIFLIATQSRDASWRTRWEQAADHVYDLASVVPPERLIAAIHSMAVNWEYDVVVIQNSLPAYSAVPHLRRDLPGIRVIDWIHAVDPGWDFVSATAPVASHIDLRVAISQAAAARLRLAGVPENRIRVIRNGIDLERFHPAPPAAGNTILYAGRLDAVKRPLLLVEIASELAKLRGDFQFLVAGEGPEAGALHDRLRRSGLGSRFRLLGHAGDMPAVLAEASVVLIPSAAEGIPLVALEAFATERPVVCANVGAVSEAVTPDCGVLIEPGPGEPGRFARALHELLSDPERRTALGRAGRRKIEADYSRAGAQIAYRNLFAEIGAAAGSTQ